MFDLGMGELLIIGTVGLIVIGPRDLPEVFRQMGRFTAKARQMGREFSRAMEQAADEAGVKDVASDLNKIANPKSMGISAMKDAVDKFEKWDPMANAAKPTEPLSSSSITADEEEDFSGGATFDEAAQNIAESAAPEHGPETQALIDKQAARKAVIDESTAKLKAIEAGEAGAKPAAKPRKSRSTAKTTTTKTATSKSAASKTAAKAGSTKTAGTKAATTKTASAKTATKPAAAKSTAAKSASTKTAASKTAGASKTATAKTAAAKTDKPATAKTASKPTSRSRKTPSSTAE